MLQWNNGTWEHRAYWGANSIGYGADGTTSKHYMGALPPAGQWVQLRVAASDVGLEGSVLKGMAFSLYNGRATWDAAGRLSAVTSPTVSVTASAAIASRVDAQPGVFTFTRSGDASQSMSVAYSVGGTAVGGSDYQLSPTAPTNIAFPAGASSVALAVVPKVATNFLSAANVVVNLAPNSSYTVGSSNASVLVTGNTVPASSMSVTRSGATLRWNGNLNHTYRIGYKNNLSDPSWLVAANVVATNSSMSWTDAAATNFRQRFYIIAQID
jgi:hypothetical protein